jgi:hypothetical protein
LAFAGLSIGIWSFGGLAIGVFAVGGAAIAVWAANGGLAVASEYAVGGLAIASNANNDAARIYFDSSVFFRVATMAARHSRWLLVLVILGPVIRLFTKRQSSRAS